MAINTDNKTKFIILTKNVTVTKLTNAQGGYSNFFCIRRLGPSIYCSPKKNIRNFKHPKKLSEILATQKNIPILYQDLIKKTLKCIEMTLKLAQYCDDPKKISTKSPYPKKIIVFLKTPKNIEIQNFEPQKIAPAYVCVKISEYPPPPPPGAGLPLTFKSRKSRLPTFEIWKSHWFFFGSPTFFCDPVALWRIVKLALKNKHIYTEQKWKRYTWIVWHLYTKLCKPRMQWKVYLNVQILGNA